MYELAAQQFESRTQDIATSTTFPLLASCAMIKVELEEVKTRETRLTPHTESYSQKLSSKSHNFPRFSALPVVPNLLLFKAIEARLLVDLSRNTGRQR